MMGGGGKYMKMNNMVYMGYRQLMIIRVIYLSALISRLMNFSRRRGANF